MPQPSVQARDAGVRRVSTLTRWLIVGSTALTGLFSAVAAVTLPGHTKASASSSHKSSSTGSGATSQTTTSSGATSSDGVSSATSSTTTPTLQAPSTPITSSGSSGQVVSGGS